MTDESVGQPTTTGAEGSEARSPVPSKWTSGRVAIAVFAATMAIYLPTATWDALQITDTSATAMAAWNLGEHGTWSLPETWQDLPWRSITPDGEIVTNRFPGAIVWGAAFYAVWPDGPEPEKGHDIPFGPAGAASATSAALAVAVMFLTLDGLVRRSVALGACVLLALGTGTWTVSADSLFTHGPAQLAIVLGLLALRHDRLWLAGLALGGAMTMRPQLGVVALIVGVGLTVARRSLWPSLRVGIGAMPALGALVLHARAFAGTWVPIAGRNTDQVDLVSGVARGGEAPNLFENVLLTLGHPHRGLLLYSPFLLILVPGLRAAWRQAGDWIRVAAIAGGVAMIVQLLANPANFHGGDDFFGYRLPLEMLTLATPLLALAAQHWVLPRWLPSRMLAITGLGAVVAFAFGATVADPRLPQEEDYRRMLEDLGPHGEGYDPGDAVGFDARDS